METNQHQIETIQTKEGYEAVFRKYYQPLVSYVFTYVKEVEAAEEIVQDLFFNLWKKRNDLEITSMKSYLYRAARNHSLNLVKHINIREDYKVDNEQIRKQEEMEGGETMETKELEQRINDAISQLPEERQKIFRMSRFEGMKYREIADELEISVKTVENQMGKALQFLREQLTDYLPLWLMILLFFD